MIAAVYVKDYYFIASKLFGRKNRENLFCFRMAYTRSIEMPFYTERRTKFKLIFQSIRLAR